MEIEDISKTPWWRSQWKKQALVEYPTFRMIYIILNRIKNLFKRRKNLGELIMKRIELYKTVMEWDRWARLKNLRIIKEVKFYPKYSNHLESGWLIQNNGVFAVVQLFEDKRLGDTIMYHIVDVMHDSIITCCDVPAFNIPISRLSLESQERLGVKNNS